MSTEQLFSFALGVAGGVGILLLVYGLIIWRTLRRAEPR